MKITSFSELKRLVEGIKTNDTAVKPIIVTQKDNKNRDIPVSIPSSNSLMVKRLLMEGFEMLSNQQSYLEAVKFNPDDEDFGGFVPAMVPEEHTKNGWVDRFVRNNLGGERVGLKVQWHLPEGKFELDPWTLLLIKI